MGARFSVENQSDTLRTHYSSAFANSSSNPISLPSSPSRGNGSSRRSLLLNNPSSTTNQVSHSSVPTDYFTSDDSTLTSDSSHRPTTTDMCTQLGSSGTYLIPRQIHEGIRARRRAAMSASESYSTRLSPGFVRCPECNQNIFLHDIERHLLMCLSSHDTRYNDDVLTEDKGECTICLEDLKKGDEIARLPCLCVYHKACIQAWFKRKAVCPEHPDS